MASAPRVTVAILAGGLGTRLGELARDVPKPMVEVGGKPFLDHVVRSFAACGLTDIVLLIGHLGDQIEAYFGSRVRYSRDEAPVGTGGAVRAARHLLGDRFLLTYGDVYRRFDYDRFVNAHHDACVAVYPVSTSDGNTAIENGRVTQYDKTARLLYMDAGFSVMPATVVDWLEPTGSFEQTVFPRLAAEGALEAEIVDRDFIEIGTPDALAHAREVLA